MVSGVLQNSCSQGFPKSREKTLLIESFFSKDCNITQKELLQRFFSVKVLNFFRTSFFYHSNLLFFYAFRRFYQCSQSNYNISPITFCELAFCSPFKVIAIWLTRQIKARYKYSELFFELVFQKIS